MSRYDKYDGRVGGFRAPLNANFAYTASAPDYAHADLNKVFCVSLNANGRVIIGHAFNAAAGVGGFIGVLVLDTPLAAGEIVDVMTSGEIVEFTLANGAAAAAGTTYTTNANGDGGYGTTAANGTTITRIGTTVEATRLVVRCVQGAEPAS